MGENDGGVIFAAKLTTDFGERCLGEFAANIHGNLARHRDVPGALFGLQIRNLELEKLGHGSLNVGYGEMAVLVDREILEHVLSQLQIDFAMRERGVGNDA